MPVATGEVCRPRLSADEKRELRRMLLDGVPRPQIAEAFGVSVSTVQYYADRVFVPGQAPRSRPRPAFDPEPVARPGRPPRQVLVAGRVDWLDRAACRAPGVDPELFFRENATAVAAAVAICGGCPVSVECLARQLRVQQSFDQWGVVGGLTPRQRHLLRRRAAS